MLGAPEEGEALKPALVFLFHPTQHAACQQAAAPPRGPPSTRPRGRAAVAGERFLGRDPGAFQLTQMLSAVGRVRTAQCLRFITREGREMELKVGGGCGP